VRALETFAIYVTPFLILGAGAKLLMKRYASIWMMFKTGRPSAQEAQTFPLGWMAFRRLMVDFAAASVPT